MEMTNGHTLRINSSPLPQNFGTMNKDHFEAVHERKQQLDQEYAQKLATDEFVHERKLVKAENLVQTAKSRIVEKAKHSNEDATQGHDRAKLQDKIDALYRDSAAVFIEHDLELASQRRESVLDGIVRKQVKFQGRE